MRKEEQVQKTTFLPSLSLFFSQPYLQRISCFSNFQPNNTSSHQDMELGKNGNSDASSQESSNNQTEIKSSDGVGRSYECTFCKRGFTNAQALGGHMNIHREDKAKAKHKNQEEASNKSNLRYVSQVSSDNHLRVMGGARNYQVYSPSSNPNFQTGNYLPLWRQDPFDGHAAENSSLRIGIAPPRDEYGEAELVDSIVKGNDVDLELRLGHP